MATFIIAEYNPFHLGHLYQLQQIQGPLAVMMTGDISQRGQPTILEKYLRARRAIEFGVDLVFEMPIIYALQSAENFAYGPIRILQEAKIFDSIAFSSENSLDDLVQLQSIRQSSAYQAGLTAYEKEKKSLEEAHRLASRDLGLDRRLIRSNNILALAYLEAIDRLQSPLKVLQIKRIGSDYNSQALDQPILSASAIRQAVRRGQSLKEGLPAPILKDLARANFKSLYPYFQYKLFVEGASLQRVTGYEEGLEGLFLKNIQKEEGAFFQASVSRRYRPNRIQRLMANYLLDISHHLVDQALRLQPTYVKVLAFNDQGREMLQAIKRQSSLKIITNYRQIEGLDAFSKKIIALDEKASFLAQDRIRDYYGSQYIKA